MGVNSNQYLQGINQTTGTGAPTHSAVAGDRYTDTATGNTYQYTTSWQTVSYSAGGLTYFTEAQSTSAPNATVNVDSLTAIASTTNADFAIIPKGNGAILAQVPDSGITGGDKRGVYATDLQRSRAGAAQVASGGSSTVGGGSENMASGGQSTSIGGYRNYATNTGSTALGGYQNQATGLYSVTIGGQLNQSTNNYATSGGYNSIANGNSSVALGFINTANGTGSVALGGNNTAGNNYAMAFGSNSTASNVYSSVLGGQGGQATKTHSTVVGGYYNSATGDYSVALGGFQNQSIGSFSLTGGRDNIARGTDVLFGEGNSTISGLNHNTAIGYYNTISGGYHSVALGGYNSCTGQLHVALGDSNTLTAPYGSAILGINCLDNGFSRFVYGNQGWVKGDSQSSKVVLNRRTTNATPTPLIIQTPNGSGEAANNQLTLANNNSIRFKGTIIGRQSGSTNTSAWDIDGIIQRGTSAATTTLLISNVNVVQNTPAWGTPTLTANTTLGCLTVTVIGALTTNIQWTCVIDTTEVIYA